MKIYNNEFTKKILLGLTTITLMTLSSSEASMINNADIKKNSIMQKIQINNEIGYADFYNFYEQISTELSFLQKYIFPASHIRPDLYYLYADYDKGLKKLIYFANYDYISNTALEEMLRNEKTIDTYSSSDDWGLNMNLVSAYQVLNDILVYNHKCFVDFEYDDFDLITNRKFKMQDGFSLINPSKFLINEFEKEYVNNQYNTLIELINYCSINDKQNIENCLSKYFNFQQNSLNISNSAKWLNNVTNNNLCIKILETYMIQYYDNDILDDIFSGFQYSELYFNTEYELFDEYNVDNVNFDNVEDVFLKMLLECDRKLHSDVYCNTDEILLESIDVALQKYKEKIR